MRVQDVIRGTKTDLQVSDWGKGTFPKAKFRLSRAGKRAYNLGNAWQWRFAEFTCAERRFILRLIICVDKMKAHAHLALRNEDGNLTVLCSYEFHADRFTGWHLHSLCGEKNDIDAAPTGTLVHGPWVKRLPHCHAPHRRTVFYEDMQGGPQAWLWHESLRFFRIDEKGSLV
jgi:hypothetical protein